MCAVGVIRSFENGKISDCFACFCVSLKVYGCVSVSTSTSSQGIRKRKKRGKEKKKGGGGGGAYELGIFL